MRRGTSNANTAGRKEAHVAIMVVVMVAAFFIAWGPYAVFSLIIAFSDIQLSQALQIMPCLFAKSSVCYNPIIYFYFNKQVSFSILIVIFKNQLKFILHVTYKLNVRYSDKFEDLISKVT